MNRAERRRQQQAMNRERRRTDVRVALSTAPTIYEDMDGADAAGSPLTEEQLRAAVEKADAATRAQAAEFLDRTRKLIASIPAHLRETPEAQLMVARVQASWMVPFAPALAERFAREWFDFLQAQPENIAQRTPLWLPGQPVEPNRLGPFQPR